MWWYNTEIKFIDMMIFLVNTYFLDCLYAYFCSFCYLYNLTNNAKVSFFTIFCGGLVPIRTKIRTERKIWGTIVDDYYSVGCCGFCAMIQMNREVIQYLYKIVFIFKY